MIRDEMNERFNKIFSLMHENPKLNMVKPEILSKKIID